MLICRNLNKTFTDGDTKVNVLKDINIEVLAGETVAVVGSSGSGKSTLLHVISGLEKACSGEITLDNNLISDLNENALCDIRLKKIGFIYQSHHLIKELNVKENISLPLMIAKNNMDIVTLKTNELIEKIGLKHRSEYQIDKLSGGERQRVAIARAIIHNPKIIFADEPTGNLDKNNAKNIFSLLSDLANFNNSSLIVATHDLEMSDLLNKKLHIENGLLLDYQNL